MKASFCGSASEKVVLSLSKFKLAAKLASQ